MIDAATKAKAVHVLRTRGRAPVCLRAMDDGEIAALAALVGANGLLLPGAVEKYRLIMVEHNERLKATDAEFDGDE